jgi:NADH-quinone oxidoreductase subunit L
MLNLTPYILLFPLLGFVVLGLLGRALPRWLIAAVGCGVVLIAFGLAVANFASLLAAPTGAHSTVVPWTWVTSGTLRIDFSLLADPLSVVMLLIVTGVGFLIHVYSVGYMEGDPGYWRFFAFLNFFVFAMCLLVAAANFLFLLIGWAGVGLASYLLIGFWYTRPSAVAAAQKAFVVNVIGDFGLLLAIFLLFRHFGTLEYGGILRNSSVCVGYCPYIPSPPQYPLNSPEVIAVTLLLFVAAAAKSAQFPLHVWLPDAMEGPTPVSALIHAATMVTAGVYLVARAAPLYDRAPTALGIVAGVGGFTALFAATIALVQHDIKRVLAYSTMSQLGYMFMGEGAGGYSAGIFHLTTHAYFKALLFMAAGAVIHALGGEQDIRKMGGLRRKLPWTAGGVIAGGLALAAIVPFAGFWSKDAVLSAVWQRALLSGGAGWYLLYTVGLVTAGLTGFYIFRLIFAVFWGTYRGPVVVPAHGSDGQAAGSATLPSQPRGQARRDSLGRVHEVGLAMLAPMAILAVLSFAGGFYGLPWKDLLGDLLSPVVGAPVGLTPGTSTYWLSLALGLACSLLGIAVAWSLYGARQPRFAPSRNPVHQFLSQRWYVDTIYDRLIVRPTLGLGRLASHAIEGLALDGGGRGVSWALARTSAGLRALQTGYVRTYALGILLGAAALVLYFVVFVMRVGG